jgi:acetolactate synthase small subunit
MERTMKTLTADRAVSAERALNMAIVNADITRGFEEYLALVDQYYAEDVEVSTDTFPDPLLGKNRLKSIFSASSHRFT